MYLQVNEDEPGLGGGDVCDDMVIDVDVGAGGAASSGGEGGKVSRGSTDCTRG